MKMKEIVRKSEFAQLVGVSRGRVSQWIAGGQISGDALVDEGQMARIRVATAIGQLRNAIDGSLGTARLKLDGIPVEPKVSESGNNSTFRAAENQPAGVDRTVETDIKRQRLEQLELSNDRARIEAAARNGRFTSTAGAKQQMGRIASTLLNVFEGFLGQLATKLAAHFGLVQRDVLHVLRSEFRLFRASAAGAMAREAAQLPEFVEDELPEADPDAGVNVQ
jgi:hypothetical protein